MLGKREIEASAISGIPVDWRAVCRQARGRAVVTLKHDWPESTDARVWHGVKAAALAKAEALANRLGRSVEIFSYHGDRLEQVEPSR